jgi:DNA invertase Pin-like site-specific DNA recombinase
MEKTIIYNRVSTTDQHPELQIEECKEFCKEKNWEVINILQEKASAFKDETKREKFNEMIERAKRKEFQHIVVWNMDRFSRQPEEEVLKLVKKLNLLYGVDINAVHGDLWSELVQSISKIKEQGFLGEAISEFLEKIIRGLEFQRAHRESQTKSERVKLAVVKKEGQKTKSAYGKKWGRKSIITKRLVQEVKNLKEKGFTIRTIAKQVYYYDRSGNKKNPSPAMVCKVLKI